MEKQNSTGNQPEKKFSTGAINATVWKNTGKSKTGEEVEFRTITLQRAYKDKNDEWQHTNSMRVNDLPKAALVLNKAYEYLVLRNTSVQTTTDSPSVDGEIFEEIVM